MTCRGIFTADDDRVFTVFIYESIQLCLEFDHLVRRRIRLFVYFNNNVTSRRVWRSCRSFDNGPHAICIYKIKGIGVSGITPQMPHAH